MIYVEVSGTRKKYLKLLIKEACYFYLYKLKVTKRTIPLDIRIVLCDISHEGLCDFNHDYQFPEFELSLNRNIDEPKILSTLAHEVVHLKQFLRKEIKNVNGVYHWKKQVALNEEWEEEAYHMENILYKEFINEKFK